MRVEQDFPTRRHDPLLVGAVIVVGVFAVVLSAWLLIGVYTDAAPRRMTVEVDNQTSLTLQVEAVDESGAELTLGRMQPGEVTARTELPVPESRTTFVAYYGDREVWRSEPVGPDELAGSTQQLRITPNETISQLEQQGFE